MSNTSIMSVREMIDTAFGEQDTNTVNFKLIQTILYLLARQLRVLERCVAVEIGYTSAEPSTTSLSVTEIKMHAVIPKKKKKMKAETITSDDTKHKSEKKGQKTAQYDAKQDIAETNQVREGSEKVGLTSKRKPHTTADSGAVADTDATSSDKKTSKTSTKPITEKTEKPPYKSTPDTSQKITKDREKSQTIAKDKSYKSRTDSALSDKSETELSDKGSEKTEKFSSDDTTSDKSSIYQKSASKQSPEKSDKITDKSNHKSSGKSTDKKESFNLLEKMEEERERELRVIRQRSDSRVEPKQSPTPMASIESIDVQEKLLIVERVPTGEAKSTASHHEKRTPQLSIVTQSQFEALAVTVRALQSQFQSQIGKAGFPENAKLMQELRKGASLTDAMAALQLSARLEATEKTLQQMMALVTDLASKTPGVNIKQSGKIDGAERSKFEKEVGYGPTGPSSQQPPNVSRKSKAFEQPQKKSILVSTQADLETPLEPSTSVYQQRNVDDMEEDIIDYEKSGGMPEPNPDWITFDDLDLALEELHDDIMKTVNTIINRSKSNADTALQIANKLEGKIDASLNLGTRMDDLEMLVSEYTEQVNILDTGLSSQMTNYQELLTQMQYDLETGLDNMAEALANTGGDTAAVTELNGHFTNLQLNFDNSAFIQKELKENQEQLAMDLKNLWKQIENLRDTKSDREEVEDALRDKAGIGALNGLVTLEQFDAVRGDFEKRVGAAYDKFNNQEIIWQKAIDELLRELNDKADLIQVISLREDINKHMNILNGRIKDMLEIVGEPEAATVARKIHRDAACLSCSTPAHMKLEEPDIIPKLPAFSLKRSSATGGVASPSKAIDSGDGDHRNCYPGLPIPHARDPRSHICHRYCGGSHTKLTHTLNKAPACVNVETINMTTDLESDGKIHLEDEQRNMTPCIPCNRRKIPKPLQDPQQDPSKEEAISCTAPSEFCASAISNVVSSRRDTSVSLTPPPPIDD